MEENHAPWTDNVCMQTREMQKKKVEQHVGTANKTYGRTEWEESGVQWCSWPLHEIARNEKI